MRCLVTGASGFLGSHLCDLLLDEGHDVVGLDNLITGRLRNLETAFEKSHFQFIEHDVEMPLTGEYERIFHLASPASPPMYQRDPVRTAKTNFLGTLHTLELAERTGARMMMTSTSEVYGDPLQHPQCEDYHGNVNPIGPRACYDEGKRIAETLAFDFWRTRGVDVRVARVFNCYGPRMNPDDGRVISNFINQALRGDDITLFGDGTQTRSFCYVRDLVKGLRRFTEIDRIDMPINIGNPAELQIREVAKQILEIVGSSSQLVHREIPQDDPKRRKPDITRAEALLNWRPETSLREGLLETVAYFRTYFVEDAA